MEPDEVIRVHLPKKRNFIAVRTSELSASFGQPEGRAFPWRRGLSSNAHKVDIPVGSLLSAVRKVSVVFTEEERKCDLTFGGGLLRVQAATKEIGSAEAELPIPYDGPSVTARIDGKYIRETLSVLPPADPATIGFTDAHEAIRITAADGTEGAIATCA
jgi:DNA polymerase III sliding clamp (beta) subunit (PCNA family)